MVARLYDFVKALTKQKFGFFSLHQEFHKVSFSVALHAKKIQGDLYSLCISTKQVPLPKGNTILQENLFSQYPDLAIVKGSFGLS